MLQLVDFNEFTPHVINATGYRLFPILPVCLLVSLCAVGSHAEEWPGSARVSVERIETGFNGYYKLGSWSPLTVTVHTNRATTLRLSVEAQEPDGSWTTLPGPEINLPKAGSHRLHALFKNGRIDSVPKFHVDEGAKRLVSGQTLAPADDASNRHVPLEQSAMLVATLGKPAGFTKDSADRGFYTAHLESQERLPSNFDAYDGLDALVLAGPFDLDPETNTAVRRWVKSGGHLIIAAGSGVPKYLKSSVAEWVSQTKMASPPIPVLGTDRANNASGLEAYVPRTAAITPLLRRGTSVDVARFGPVDGQKLIRGSNGPLLVRVAYGFGRITFLGLDLNKPPLSTWPQAGSVVEKILFGGVALTKSPKLTKRRQLSHTGITDLATQLHSSQQQFPRVSRFSRYTIMGMVAVYLLLIGPVDFLVIHRLLKKPKLTWITFPSMVILAGALAAWGAVESNGRELQLNQLDVIDVDVQSHSVLSQSWLTIYSPKTRRYQVGIQPNDLTAQAPANVPKAGEKTTDARICWNGIPETAFGGMYRDSGIELPRPSYSFSTQALEVDDVPISIWSAKTLTATWQQWSMPLVEVELESRRPGQLTGTIKHQFGAPIDDWIIAFENTIYHPVANSSDLSGVAILPNREFSISPTSPGIRQRVLRSFLTGARRRRVDVGKDFEGDEIVIDHEAYNPLNDNPADILRMITFYKKVGGKGHTTLDNHALRNFDLSDSLDQSRAVLFGRLKLSAARVLLDGKPVEPTQNWTFIRLLLPVRQNKFQPKELPRLKEGLR